MWLLPVNLLSRYIYPPIYQLVSIKATSPLGSMLLLLLLLNMSLLLSWPWFMPGWPRTLVAAKDLNGTDLIWWTVGAKDSC